jgi:hypothetical protein
MARTSRVIARKHHYVPEMYLSGFADAKDQCYAVDAATRKTFRSTPRGIAAERDYNLIDEPGMPPDALEQELAKLESDIAPGIKRVREMASFGKDGKDREDVMNLAALLAARNPRTRKDMEKLFTRVFRALIAAPFEDKARWEAVVAAMTADGKWPQDTPADFEGFKKFVEDNKDNVRPHKNFTLMEELRLAEMYYLYLDAGRWRILKAKAGAGDFVTTDHPVCIHRPADGINYGQQFAQGYGLADRNILLPLSSKVALIARTAGDEDVVEVGKHTVVSFNATVMGFAIKQVYAVDDTFSYTRQVGQTLGSGATLPQDPNLQVRGDGT